MIKGKLRKDILAALPNNETYDYIASCLDEIESELKDILNKYTIDDVQDGDEALKFREEIELFYHGLY